MGAGRKTQTFIGSAGQPLQSGFLSAKNLPKKDLGGAIFGCKHSTMRECLDKQLFGLPFPHFTYVRNIEPGLPLFLFNYTDRKMHGIFEAASYGEMNIDPYAWTDNGAERTPFPAQVRIFMKKKCEPLMETQYKEVIKDNYYQEQHFWFELDHAQTKALVSLFTPSPLPAIGRKPLVAMNNTKWKTIPSPKHGTNTGAGEPKKDCKSSVDLKTANKFEYLAWDDGDKELCSSSRISSSATEEGEIKEQVSDWEDWEDNLQGILSGASPQPDGASQNSLERHSSDEELDTEMQKVLHKLKELSAGCELSGSLPKDCSDDNVVPCMPEDVYNESGISENSFIPAAEKENTNALDLCQGNTELVQIIKELTEKAAALEKKQAESEQEMQLLKGAVKESGSIIQQLKDQVVELELKLKPSMSLVGSACNDIIGQNFGSEKVIYLIGGFNGMSWLSALDSFSPAMDALIPLKPMSCARSYASATAVNDYIIVFGGGDGASWYSTAECYDRRKEEWSLYPPLSRAKGSLAGVTLDKKIFAIGGGDGLECFSEVEMFDPGLGKWIYSQSMLQRRFATAAAELQGVLYAAGGFDGQSYLMSAERYDLREGYWTKLPSMNTRRGCHSLAVFNEKLYAIGGYDGEKMVSSVETFEPRSSSWMMSEPMNVVRGYAAAAVLGNNLFAIGGLKDGENIVDTVEFYREGAGWSTCSFKSIGKRCFFSALVL